jgi:hypothetical protein
MMCSSTGQGVYHIKVVTLGVRVREEQREVDVA